MFLKMGIQYSSSIFMSKTFTLPTPPLVSVTSIHTLYRTPAKTLGWPAVIEIAQMVRATCPNALIVIGGPHLSIYPKESLSWECFDLAVVGDGEDTFLEICERIDSGSEWTDILGTYARLPSGDVVKNPPRPLSKDINKYPMTAWDLVNVSNYHCDLAQTFCDNGDHKRLPLALWLLLSGLFRAPLPRCGACG